LLTGLPDHQADAIRLVLSTLHNKVSDLVVCLLSFSECGWHS